MLRHLTIRNFVLVDRLELEFSSGFGALTGETGAGKSILVDALAFVLGERAESGLVRSGSERAEVTAQFDLHDCPEAAEWLRAQDMEADEGVLLRRVLDANGRSRAYLNGSPVPLQQLREIAESLVDIHGQHAHQSLLRSSAQRTLLDTHARLMPQVDTVAVAWRVWQSALETLDTATSGAQAIIEERERLEWQIHELSTLGFSTDEWELLSSEHKRLAHAASLAEGTRFSLDLLTEGETACEQQINSAANRLHELAEYDPTLAEILALLKAAQAELSEASSALRRYADHVEIDPQRLAEAEQRIEAVLGCARKFRTTPENLPQLLASWQERLSVLEETADIQALTLRVKEARDHYMTHALRLSEDRAKAATALSSEVSRVMQQLALSGGYFEAALIPVETGHAQGLEQVEFRIGGLSGDDSRPLAKVASGGEISRISLAIQVVTSQAARVPTLIFDEVDVGIGGGVAEVVGRLLHELGKERQVLCVTHLPQVAARANWQWRVSKKTLDGRIVSELTLLNAADRIEEIARMLGGVDITAISRQHAEEMLALNACNTV